MNNFIYYTLNSLGAFNLRFFRYLVGGVWYKQSMSGELPMCYGYWWTQKPLKPNRYHYIEEIEKY